MTALIVIGLFLALGADHLAVQAVAAGLMFLGAKL